LNDRLVHWFELDCSKDRSIVGFIQVWINQGDIILISLRDYQDSKADVILKYTTEEARNLKAYGELPENGKPNFLFDYWGTLVEMSFNY